MGRVLFVFKAAYAPIDRAERLFLQLNNLSTMISQVSDSWLSSWFRLGWLITLLSVKEIISKRNAEMCL